MAQERTVRAVEGRATCPHFMLTILNDPDRKPLGLATLKEMTMTRFATTFALVLLSAGAAMAQDAIVTRAEPAELFVTPADLALLPAATVNLTTGAPLEAAAGDLLTARDRALTGLDAADVVSVTVFEGNGRTVSVR